MLQKHSAMQLASFELHDISYAMNNSAYFNEEERYQVMEIKIKKQPHVNDTNQNSVSYMI